MAKQKSNSESKKVAEKQEPLSEAQKTIAKYLYNQGETEEKAIELARKMA